MARTQELLQWRQQNAPFLIGSDPIFVAMLETISRVAITDCDVLLTGESGVGKELVARAIHLGSRRRDCPFVGINCAAIPHDLAESELFGHAEGAFTGATRARPGKVLLARDGTLFLDEVGEMALPLQAKVLRVLQERELTAVGDSKSVKVSVRIVSATNQDLLLRCRERTFRTDLYYRLNVVPIEVPPLRLRPNDICELAEHFVASANQRHCRKVSGIDDEVLSIFRRYPWPGNVRELKNLVERLIVLKRDDGHLQVADLPSSVASFEAAGVLHADAPVHSHFSGTKMDINATVELLQTRLTVDALRRAGGNKARAAELLGLKRTTLVERIKKLRIPN